jgi:hypothetical protein
MHYRWLVDNGLCGSYPTKPDRIITSGLPTTRPESSGLAAAPMNGEIRVATLTGSLCEE